jgi:cold shock CspA family protein
MPNGTIKNYSAERGYGFIACTGKKDLFFHIKSFAFGKIPEPGQHVTFDIGPDASGRPMAINIRLLDTAAALR